MTVKQIGPYRIDNVLGRGGMGTVYGGVHVETNQRVAVKVLSAGHADDAHLRDRFEAEIETLLQLKHPNIVEIYAYGDDGELMYFSMELVDGPSLFDELRRGRPFPWTEVVDIGIDVCAALRHAHDRGVIHRDLKPGNLLLTPDGRVKLTDFGIGKMFGRRQMTAVGGVLGTADYMSPEQAQGLPITTRSDLYSLGSVLYALLARRPPFAAKSLPQVIQSLTHEDAPPVSRYAPDIPGELDALIARLLSKDPENRIGTAQAVAKRLAEIAANPTPADAQSADHEFDVADGENTKALESHTASAASSPQGKIVAPPQNDTKLLQTVEMGGASDRAAVPQSHPASAEKVTHFTTVEQAHRDRAVGQDDPFAGNQSTWQKIRLPVLVLLVLVALAVLGILYAPPLRSPPDDTSHKSRVTADELFAAIESQRGRPIVAEHIQTFLETYPADARAPQIRQYADDMPAMRLLESMRERIAGTEDLATPIEQDLLEAVLESAVQPEHAQETLETLIRVYGRLGKQQPAVATCLRAAEILLAEIHAGLQQRLELINQQIDWCQQHSDDAVEVNNICGGIVTLYQDKPWAASAVLRAKETLGQIER